MRLYYSDIFELPLPADHRFPERKYRLLREKLQSSTDCQRFTFCTATAATDAQLLLVHTAEYLDKLKSGSLSQLEQRRIGFPWSRAMVERSRRSTGATIEAARAAMAEGAAVHLAGGTHHAFPDHGQGYCVFNDVAVAIRVLQRDGLVRHALVLDLDVHQGNGTAAIFAHDPTAFTFSMHAARNFPFAKTAGDLDIALPDGTADEAYLATLRDALDAHLMSYDADVVFYLAGADCYRLDRLGRLKLTQAGLAQRDRMVIDFCRRRRLPMVVVMAGGYAENIDDIVTIHTNTVACLLEFAFRRSCLQHRGHTAPG